MSEIRLSDYSLVGKRTQQAIEEGLADATWYMSPVPKPTMRQLLQRRDWPAVRGVKRGKVEIRGSGRSRP